MKQTICDKCGAVAKKHFRIDVTEGEDFDLIGPGLKYHESTRRAVPLEMNQCRPALELCRNCWGAIQQNIEEVRGLNSRV